MINIVDAAANCNLVYCTVKNAVEGLLKPHLYDDIIKGRILTKYLFRDS